MTVLQMAVFRHQDWVRTFSETIGANANRPFGKNHRGKRKCVGGFASRQRGTHLQVALGYVENPRFPENCHLALCGEESATAKKMNRFPAHVKHPALPRNDSNRANASRASFHSAIRPSDLTLQTYNFWADAT